MSKDDKNLLQRHHIHGTKNYILRVRGLLAMLVWRYVCGPSLVVFLKLFCKRESKYVYSNYKNNFTIELNTSLSQKDNLLRLHDFAPKNK